MVRGFDARMLGVNTVFTQACDCCGAPFNDFFLYTLSFVNSHLHVTLNFL